MQTEQKKINIDRKGYLLLLFEMYLSSILKQITFSSLLPFNLNQVKLCYFVVLCYFVRMVRWTFMQIMIDEKYFLIIILH